MRQISLTKGYILLIIVLLGGLTACDKKEPVKLGFIGGLTGRVADLGIAGRNGTTLAVEEWNHRGGVNGHPIQLLVGDDKQDETTAAKTATELLDQGVVAVIGHMTSAMSVATLPLFNQRQIVLVSPTTTTEDLTGKDDYFFRVCEGNGRYARVLATTLSQQGLKHIAVIYDLGNKAYSESYLNSFRQAFAETGGAVSGAVGYVSGPDVSFLDLARQALASRPDGVLMICNAVDTALLAQQFKKSGSRLPLATSPWGGTERLISLGGQAVEGIILQQYFDRDNNAPAYQTFRRDYLDRFGEEPGFASVSAYDATNLTLAALSRQSQPRELKASLLSSGDFPGIQDKIIINRFGDAARTIYSHIVRNGKFVTLTQASATPEKP